MCKMQCCAVRFSEAELSSCRSKKLNKEPEDGKMSLASAELQSLEINIFEAVCYEELLSLLHMLSCNPLPK